MTLRTLPSYLCSMRCKRTVVLAFVKHRCRHGVRRLHSLLVGETTVQLAEEMIVQRVSANHQQGMTL